jgi:hypothetical protein
MAITVTAAQSGAGVSNGLALAVKVLTGAAPAQNGTTASSETVTAPQLAITPAGSGSLVYGAVVNGVTSTAFTANGATAFSANYSDGTDGVALGTFRTTSVTTSGTPVTVGASAPAEVSGDLYIALAEILAAGTLAEDASSPAAVTASAQTVTTAAFAPPPGSLLVAMAATAWAGSGALAVTVSGGGLTWAQLSGTGTVDLASVWIAYVPGVPSSRPLIPPAPFSPMNFQRQAQPSQAPVLVTAADSGTGADTAGATTTQAASFPLIPPGFGSPMGFASQAPSRPVFPVTAVTSEAGTGSDAGAVTATVSDSDSGAGTDSGRGSAGASDADAGSGADSGSFTVVAADTGTGADDSGGGGALHFTGTPAYTVARGASAGTVTLNGTTAVPVVTGAVSANSLILLTVQPGAAPAGIPYVASVGNGSGFTVKSTSASDTAVVVGWAIVEAV